MEKRILCYGDSNTWGQIAGYKKPMRYEKNTRWTGRLQKILGIGFEVIEEGLSGRTLTTDDAISREEGKNGLAYLKPCLDSHFPLDIVILMLGTNELKKEFDNSPEEIGTMIEAEYVKKILNWKANPFGDCVKIIIISPPLVDEKMDKEAIFLGGEIKSHKLRDIYGEIAIRNECEFIDGTVLEIGNDGVHLSENGHECLAFLVREKIGRILL